MKSETLVETSPELAKEWDFERNPLPPNLYLKSSNDLVWWIGKKCKHRWDAKIRDRAVQGRNCPYCSDNRVLKGFNDLLHKHPKVVSKYWDYNYNILKPDQVFAQSNKYFFWNSKKCGHSWIKQIQKMTTRNTGCPVCQNDQVSKGINDFSTNAPRSLLKEWDHKRNLKDPSDVIEGGGAQSAWWIGKDCGHRWFASISNRLKGSGCPTCSGHQVLKGFNDLKTKASKKIVQEFHLSNNICPSMLYYHSRMKAIWQCSEYKTHIWQAEVRSRVKNNTKCPYCTNQKVSPGYNDIESKSPKIASEWDKELNSPLLPKYVLYGSNEKHWWKCTNCKNSFLQSPYERSLGAGCAICNSKIIVKGTNDLGKNGFNNLLKEYSKEHNNGSAFTVATNSSKKIAWVCKKNNSHKWICSVSQRTRKNGSGGSNCPFCAGTYVTKGINDLNSYSDKELIKEWDLELNDLTPDQVPTFSSKKKYWWKCRLCELRWPARVKDRTMKNSGCPDCNKPGKRIIEEFSKNFQECGFNTTLEFKIPFKAWHNGQTSNDILIYKNSKKYILEFDGMRWHKDKKLIDQRKSEIHEGFIKNHIIDGAFRIRNSALPIIKTKKVQIIKFKSNKGISHKDKKIIKKLSQIILEKIKNRD